VDHHRPDAQLCDRIFQNFRGEIFPVLETSSERDSSIVQMDARLLQVISIIGFARPD